MPSEIGLVPNTLKYGAENCSGSAFMLLFISVFFIISSYYFLKIFVKMKKSKSLNGKKRALKVLPILAISFSIYLILWYVFGKGIDFEKVKWQSDYFLIFMLTLSIFAISIIPYMSSDLRAKRSIKQFFIIGTFKVSLFALCSLLLTPYYVLFTSKTGGILSGVYPILSLIIFATFTITCFFVFGRSIFAPALSVVVMWGACMSYYDTFYAFKWCIAFNGSGLFLTALGLIFGLGTTDLLSNIFSQKRPFTAVLYIGLLWIIVGVTWFFLWWYYCGWDHIFGGTAYESFHWDSWYPQEKIVY